MPRKSINWGSNEDFITKYQELKSSRKMGEFYNCTKTTILNHAKQIGFDPNSIERQYKLSEQDKIDICKAYSFKTSTELAQQYNVSRGMITKIWYDAQLQGKIKDYSKASNNLVGKNFGLLTVLSKTNKRASNGGVYWHCRCQCGQEKDIMGQSLLAGTSLSCGLCSNISKGNIKIKEILTANKISFETEKKFITCKDLKELPFDFYVNKQYLIEYDGIQHFDKNSMFNYEYTHKHDLIKNQWCKDNNIPLIRIPYTHFKDLCLEDLLLETSQFIL